MLSGDLAHRFTILPRRKADLWARVLGPAPAAIDSAPTPRRCSRSLANGELVVEPVLDSDWEPIAELTAQYVDPPLGMVDASVVALADRRGLEVIALATLFPTLR